MPVPQTLKATLFGDGELERQDVRVITARYNIGNMRNPGESRRRFFACRINQINSETMALIVPVTGTSASKLLSSQTNSAN